MFAPHAPATVRFFRTVAAIRIPVLLILSLLFLAPPPLQAGSPWERGSGEQRERTLPPIPQAREAGEESVSRPATEPRSTPVVAMLDFDTTTLSPELQDAFAQALWAEFYQSPATRVLPRKELRRYLFAWDLYPQQPVGKPVSVGQTARALKADYLIHGHINQADGATMLDYRVYSTRLDGIVTKNNDVRTASLREMALLIPDLAGSMLSAIGYAESQVPSSSSAISAGGAQLTSTQGETAPSGAGEADGSPESVEFARDSRAETAAAERERAHRLEEAHREALTLSKEAAVLAAPEVTQPPETAKEDGMATAPSMTAASPAPRPTELAMVSPPYELAPIEAPGEVSGSKSRVNLQPVRRVDSSSGSSADEPPADSLAPDQPEDAAPQPTPMIEVETPDTPIDLTSREAARQAYEKSRDLPAGDSAAQIGLLEQAVVLDPTELEYAKSLALAYYKAGRYDDCIEASRKAADLAPGDSIVQTILGSALFESGRFEEARDAHTHSLELDSSNLYARFNLALTLQALGSPRALAAWGEFLELSEGVPAQAGNRERALEYYDDLKAATR